MMPMTMKESDGKPGDNWGISLVIVHPVDLFATMEIEASLVLLHLIGCDVPLASHSPDRWNHIGIFRDLRPLY